AEAKKMIDAHAACHDERREREDSCWRSLNPRRRLHPHFSFATGAAAVESRFGPVEVPCICAGMLVPEYAPEFEFVAAGAEFRGHSPEFGEGPAADVCLPCTVADGRIGSLGLLSEFCGRDRSGTAQGKPGTSAGGLAKIGSMPVVA